jgi:hypothetical protein
VHGFVEEEEKPTKNRKLRLSMDTRLEAAAGSESSSNRGGTEFEVQNWLDQLLSRERNLVEIVHNEYPELKLCRTVPGAARTSRNLSILLWRRMFPWTAKTRCG